MIVIAVICLAAMIRANDAKKKKKMLLIDRAALCDIGLIDRHNAAAYLSPGNRFLFKSLRGSLRVSRSAGRSAGRSVKATSFFN